jgi:eukaryotic-like serine/threonine-protein kinase
MNIMQHRQFADATTGNTGTPSQQPVIGMYHVEKAVGTGGMGTVYLGRHALLGRAAAIKVLLPSLSRNIEVVERFFNEARALTRITDPGIVQIFDFGHLGDGRAFIVMEFLDGESMHTRLRRIRRFDVAVCLRLSRLMCKSLAAVHAKGIVHRDLKPDNIFIVGDASAPGGERTKIFDFGIAKQTEDATGIPKTHAGILMGTPMYMSPEQCRGTGDIDHRSDIYSIACVMFTMLTGRSPFGRRAPGELVMAHLREPAPLVSSFLTGVPAIVEDVLQRCLKKSPEERFQSMTELSHAVSVAEQILTRAPTRGAPGASANMLAWCSAEPKPSADGQMAAPVSRGDIAVHERVPAWRNGITVPKTDHAGPCEPGTMMLHGASCPSSASGARAGSSRRRLIGGAVAAVLIGVVCAVVIPGNDNHDGVPLRATPEARAADPPNAVPPPQPDAVDPPAPASPASAPASGIARLQDTDRSKEITPSPPHSTLTTVWPDPARPRSNGKRQSHTNPRGDHANATQSEAPANVEPQSDESQNVTRGD